ncbi:hypothetical protein CM15mP27_0670 [bacterium]|nr:MAG: hypothetical protein CM15mP27_0670 [bacterium]
MIKLLQLIVVVSFFSCSNEKNKNNNLEDVLYNSAIDNRSTNYNNNNTNDININKKIVGYRHLNELIKSKTVIKELDLVEYYNENKNQFLRDGDEVYCFRFITDKIKTANNIKTTLLRIKDSNEDEFGQLIDTHKPSRELINENRVKKSYYELFFNKKNDVVGPLKFDNMYLIFYIDQRYNKGTIKDFISVQDDIYDRVYKINSEIIKNQIIDSLMVEYSENGKTK